MPWCLGGGLLWWESVLGSRALEACWLQESRLLTLAAPCPPGLAEARWVRVLTSTRSVVLREEKVGWWADYQQCPLCDRYLVTFSPLMDTQDDPQAIIIWDILTGQKKRGFHCESSAHWPIFK